MNGRGDGRGGGGGGGGVGEGRAESHQDAGLIIRCPVLNAPDVDFDADTAGIVHGKTVVLSVIHDESTLTLYIPVHNDD